MLFFGNYAAEENQVEKIFQLQIEKLNRRKGTTLRDIRKVVGLSLAELVSVLDTPISLSQLSRVESGKTGFSDEVKKAYANAFPGVDLEKCWQNTQRKG